MDWLIMGKFINDLIENRFRRKGLMLNQSAMLAIKADCVPGSR